MTTTNTFKTAMARSVMGKSALSSMLSASVFTFSLMALPAAANPLADLSAGFESGTVSGSLRYRYEYVDQENALANANASTVKARITFASGTVNGLSSVIELDHAASIGDEDYNSSANGNGGNSIVADVTGSDINQAYIKYSTSAGDFALGKQRIAFGTQRYVGGVAWRQNEQTFDAFTYNYKNDSLSLSYAYVDEVHRIFEGDGSSVQTESFDSNSHFLRLSSGNLNGYVYALDFENGLAASNITYGLDYKKTFSDLTLTGSLAMQSDYGDNPKSYDAMFYSLVGAYKIDTTTLNFGYDVMGSDDGNANFATPLATLHKWAGWADLFLGTGSSNFNDGLEDAYIGVAGNINGIAVAATYHDFTGNDSGSSLGSEIDAVATYKFSDNITGQFKYANYSADSFGVDTEKFWFMLTVGL